MRYLSYLGSLAASILTALLINGASLEWSSHIAISTCFTSISLIIIGSAVLCGIIIAQHEGLEGAKLSRVRLEILLGLFGCALSTGYVLIDADPVPRFSWVLWVGLSTFLVLTLVSNVWRSSWDR